MEHEKKISIKKASQLMGKSQEFVRIGLQRNLLPFGTAVKVSNRYSYYISPKLFYEYTGYNKEVDNGNSENNI
ncbi:MAG: hypothetical protein ACK5HP_01310 [Bacilli bacterium]